MKDNIVSIISRITEKSVETLLGESGESWDSLQHVELIITLEEEYNVTFSQEEIADARNVNKIVELIERKVEK